MFPGVVLLPGPVVLPGGAVSAGGMVLLGGLVLPGGVVFWGGVMFSSSVVLPGGGGSMVGVNAGGGGSVVGVNAGGGAGGFSTGLEGCGPVGTAVVKGDAGPSTGAARCTGTGFGTKDLGLLTGDRKERGRPRPVAWGGGGGGGASGITASPGG